MGKSTLVLYCGSEWQLCHYCVMLFCIISKVYPGFILKWAKVHLFYTVVRSGSPIKWSTPLPLMATVETQMVREERWRENYKDDGSSKTAGQALRQLKMPLVVISKYFRDDAPSDGLTDDSISF